MDVDWFYRIILLFISLIFSAFFSGSEVALFSLEKKQIKKLKEEKGAINNYIVTLLDSPRRLLVTILLGNTIFNVAASILAVTLALDFANLYNLPVNIILVIQIVLLTIFILIIGEISPKIFATKYPLKFSRIVGIPLYWISVLVYPIAKILTDVIKFFISKIKIDKSKTVLLSSEITDLADLGKEYGSIEEEEHELIHGLVEFKSVSVREVMTPRVDIDAIPEDATYEEVIRIITESGHSRIPLFEESLDIVLGIIYAKDLLPYIAKVRAKKNFTLKEICREAMFIPETKLISDLLHDFQEKNMHIGIVVDEYGGTAGLVSLEDILEEIVGEIRDEYDKEEAEIVKLGEGKYSVLGKLPIDELNEIFEDDFTSENDDYDTVGGFIFNHAGMIPENKYILDFKNYKFTVKDVANNRINKVIVEKLPLKEDDK